MKLTIAALQSPGVLGDTDANLGELAAAAEGAAARGARLLITSEMFLTGYNLGDRLHEVDTDALLERVREIAVAHRIALLAGMPEHVDGSWFNSALLVDESGAVVNRYRKSHLFGELDRAVFTPGSELVSVATLHGVRIATLICYDVEFPEVVRAAARAGAQLIAVPTAQMAPFEFVAEHVIRTRAWENQVYVAYVNHDGDEGDLSYVGRSSIVGPSAEVLASAVHGTALLVAEIDTDAVEAAQSRNPYLTDARTDLYPSA